MNYNYINDDYTREHATTIRVLLLLLH